MALLLFLILGNTLYFVVSGQNSTDSNPTDNSISAATTHHGHVVTTPFTPELSTTSLLTQGDTTSSIAASTHHGHVATASFTAELSSTSLILQGDITSSTAATTQLDQGITASITEHPRTSPIFQSGVTSATAKLSKPTIKCQRVNNTWVEIICLSVSVTPPITYNVLRNNISYNTVNQQGAMPEKILIPLTSGSKVELRCKAQKGSVTKYSDPLLICEAATTQLDQGITASITEHPRTSPIFQSGVTSATAKLSKPTIKCQRVNNTWVEIICLSVSVTPPITYNVLRNNISYNTVNQQGAMPEKILIPLTSGSKVELRCKAQKGSVTKYSDPLLICEDEASNKEPEKSTEDQGARHLINISRLITSWGREKETYIILKVCVPIIILTLCLFIFVTIFCYKEKNVKYQV